MQTAAPIVRLATVFVFGCLVLLAASRAAAQESTGAEFTTAQREDAQQAEEVQSQAEDPQQQAEEDPQQEPQDVQQQAEDDTAEASGSEPLPTGTAATGSNPDNTAGLPDVVTIQAESCTVEEGASVTLADSDGTEARFTDGEQGVEITSTDSEVTIEGPNDENLSDHATFDTSDQSFDTNGEYTVVTSTGVTCTVTSVGGNADDAQYEEVEEIEIINVPDKKRLTKTGGMPLPGTAFLALALVGAGYSVLRFAIRRDDS
jgi:hypothetical protein